MEGFWKTFSVKVGSWFDEDTWHRFHVADPTTVPNDRHVSVEISNSVTLTGNHDVQIHDLSILRGERLDVGDGARLTGFKLDNDGVLDVHGTHSELHVTEISQNRTGATLVAKDGGLIEFEHQVVNGGTILADKGGYIKFDMTVGNSGGLAKVGGTLIAQDGGRIDVLKQANAGPQKEEAELIGVGSILKLLGGGDLNVDFHEGAQRLFLDNSKNFGGRITNFSAGDTIDVLDVNYASANFQYSYKSATRTKDPVLTVSDGQHSTDLKIVGVHQIDDFALSSDGGTGLLIGLR